MAAGPHAGEETKVRPQQETAKTVEKMVDKTTDKTAEKAGDAAKAHDHLAIGSDYEAAIKSLVEMGFGREESIKAMQAAYNNPERAAEYLVSVRPSSHMLGNHTHNSPSHWRHRDTTRC